MRGLVAFRSSILLARSGNVQWAEHVSEAHSWVLMLSKGVTASRDSVMPAPKPAITVRGPDILPSASSRSDL